MKEEYNLLQTYEIFLKIMYISLLKELYDKANRLTNSNMEGEFESKTAEQLTTSNFSYINRDLVGTKQELVKYEDLPEIIFDTSARSYVYKFSGTKEIRAIELYPESKVHRVRERDIHIYVKKSNEDAWVEVRNWKFNKDEKNGKLSFVFKEAVSAGYVKVRSIWDDRNVENESIDDYSTFKGNANNLLRIWTLENTLAEEYSYDGNSNRIRKAENGTASSYEYYKNTQGGNTAKVKYDGKWYYTYDANGNRTEKAKALISGVADKNKEYWTYEWDLWNRLVKVVQYNAPDNGECVDVSYEYDALNHRISRTSGTETTKYAYGRNGALAYQEKTVDVSVTKRSFAYLNNEIVGFTDKVGGEETVYYTVTDIQGSITEVYDNDSKLVWKSGYSAFGELAGETVDLIDFDGMYTGCDYDAETGLTYHWNRWRSEDGSCFISEDPARDGVNWYGYAGQNPMVYVDRIGLAPSNDYLGPGVAGPQPKPQNQENGFVPLVQNPSGMPQNQTPNITGPTGLSDGVVPNYNDNSGVYNNAVLSQGTNKKRSWFSINVEEPITKFIARNVFGLTPSDYVMLLDRTIVPMSESGTQFAYSERVVDCMSFCVTGLFSVFNVVKTNMVISNTRKVTSFDKKSSVPKLKNGDTVYRVYGGDSSPDGASWTTTNPGKIKNFRDKAGLPSGGDSGVVNSGQFLIQGTVEDASKVVLSRKALPLDGQTGGMNEYIIPRAIESGAVKVTNVYGVNPEF